MNENNLIEMQGIAKSFGGVDALRDVDFTLRAGSIHGLVGENGAGKSTMMKIIAGVHHEYKGSMRVDGRPVHFRSAHDALAAGIGMVHQELSVMPDLTIAENVFLGAQPVNRLGLVDYARMNREAKAQLANLGIHVDPNLLLDQLPIGMQQLVELSRVLFSGARVIILDEPTSALSPPEVELLFSVLRKLREGGRGLIFISHFLEDILNISDEITIFRNGRKIVTAPVTPEIDKGWIIERMIGAGNERLEESYLGEIKLDSKPDAPVAMAVENLCSGAAFRNVSLNVRAGEILGVYGNMGCGQLELARSLFGKIIPDSGTIRIGGAPARLKNTEQARRAGIAFVPESRRAMLFREEPVYKNMSISILQTLSYWWVKPQAERDIAAGHVKNLNIRPPSVDRALGTLSGGNQQKVALARWMTRLPKVLILSEPTRGMDVGAKEDVVRIVRSMRDQGVGVVVVSTEPETVLSLADRVLVMRKGELTREFASEAISKDRLLAAA